MLAAVLVGDVAFTLTVFLIADACIPETGQTQLRRTVADLPTLSAAPSLRVQLVPSSSTDSVLFAIFVTTWGAPGPVVSRCYPAADTEPGGFTGSFASQRARPKLIFTPLATNLLSLCASRTGRQAGALAVRAARHAEAEAPALLNSRLTRNRRRDGDRILVHTEQRTLSNLVSRASIVVKTRRIPNTKTDGTKRTPAAVQPGFLTASSRNSLSRAGLREP